MQLSKLLCFIGIHEWKNAGGYSEFSSSVAEKHYVCRRCGKHKRDIITK
ncbi:hypothetical protein [Methanohalophilus profundi]|nr:hypothetical protein [Methanohalophilus profundi]